MAVTDEMNDQTNSALLERLLTYAELSALLGVPIGTLQSWKSRGLIPHVQPPGLGPRFRESEIRSWLEAHRHMPPVQEREDTNGE